jgi:hypothetical protein
MASTLGNTTAAFRAITVDAILPRIGGQAIKCGNLEIASSSFISATGPQLIIGYDSLNYASFDVNVSGELSLNTIGLKIDTNSVIETTNTTNVISSTTGSLITAGGLGVALDSYFGGQI